MDLRWVISEDDKRVLQFKTGPHMPWVNVGIIRDFEVDEQDEQPVFNDNLHYISIEMLR